MLGGFLITDLIVYNRVTSIAFPDLKTTIAGNILICVGKGKVI